MNQRRWLVGPCAVDLDRQLVLRDGRDVPVRPKAWSLLVALLERPNAIVATRQLLDRLWPRQDVDPKVLVNIASELRGCLGDPSVLRCIPRRGYLLAAAPSAETAAETPAAKLGAEAATQPSADLSASPFVGRVRELRVLDEWADGEATQGPRVMQIRGAAGVGKTALLEHWLSRRRSDGAWNLLVGRAVDLAGGQEPFGPILQMLAARSRTPDVSSLVADLRTFAPCWLAQLPHLLPQSEYFDLVQRLAGAGTGRMVREGVELFVRWAGRGPTLLVVEDVHWIDAPTADLLVQLFNSTSWGALFVVFTCRSARGGSIATGEAARLLDHAQVGRSDVMELDRLDSKAVSEYLRRRLPSMGFDTDSLRAIEHLTDGFPLFLRALVDGMQAREAESLGVITGLQATSMTAPSLQEFVSSRVSLLSRQHRTILEALSCSVTFAPIVLVSEVLDLPDAQVEEGCDWLTRRGYLNRSPELLALPDDRVEVGYALSHEVYRRAILEGLSPKLRSALYRRWAAGLLRLGADRSTSLAAHLVLAFANAGMAVEAAQALRGTCARALSRYAPRHAVRALIQAVRHLDTVPPEPATLSLRLEICWELTGLVPFDALSANAELQQAWRGVKETSAKMDTPRARFIRWATECAMHTSLGRLDLALPALQELLESSQLLGTSERALGEYWKGVVLGSAAVFDEALAAFHSAEDLALSAQPSNKGIVFMAPLSRLWLLAVSGRLAELDAAFLALDAQMLRRDVPHFVGHGLFWTAEALRQLSCASAAARRYQALINLCRNHDMSIYLREAQLGLIACVEPANRDLDALMKLAKPGVAKSPAWSDASVSIVMAETLMAFDRYDEASQLLESLSGTHVSWPLFSTDILRLQSRCLFRAAQPVLALDRLRRSISMDIERSYLPGLLRSLHHLGRLSAQDASRLGEAVKRALSKLPEPAYPAHADLDELRRFREALSSEVLGRHPG